jgi:hypothetical protein
LRFDIGHCRRRSLFNALKFIERFPCDVKWKISYGKW